MPWDDPFAPSLRSLSGWDDPFEQGDPWDDPFAEEEDTRSLSEKLGASVSRGVASSAAGLWDLVGGVTGLPTRLGLTEKSGKYPGLDMATERAQRLREELDPKPEGLGYSLLETAAAAPLTIAKYLPAGRVARGLGFAGEALAMGAADTASALGRDESIPDALKEGAFGAVTGAALGGMSGLRAPVRAAGGAAVGGTLAAIEGGSGQDVLTNALTMGALTGILPGSKPLKEKTLGRKLDEKIRLETEGRVTETPVAVEARGPSLDDFQKTPLVRTVGEDFSPVVLHGTKSKNVATLLGERPPESQKAKRGDPVFDSLFPPDQNEFGAALLVSEPRQPHQALTFSRGKDEVLAELQMKRGAKVLDLSDEATRTAPIGLFEEKPVLDFFRRPAITDDLIEFYQSKVGAGFKERHPNWKELIAAEIDPASPDFSVSSWQQYLVPYAKAKGIDAIRLADETLVVNKEAIEATRLLPSAERAALEGVRAYPPKQEGGLFTGKPTGAYEEAFSARQRNPPPAAPTDPRITGKPPDATEAKAAREAAPTGPIAALPDKLYHGTRSAFEGQPDPSASGGMAFYTDEARSASRYGQGSGGNRPGARSNADVGIVDYDGVVYKTKGFGEPFEPWGIQDEATGLPIETKSVAKGRGAIPFEEASRLVERGEFPTINFGARVVEYAPRKGAKLLDLTKPEGRKELAAIVRSSVRDADIFLYGLEKQDIFDWGSTKYLKYNGGRVMREAIPALKTAGYDGIAFADDVHKTWAFFDPSAPPKAAPSGPVGGAATDPRITGKPPDKPFNYGRIDTPDDIKNLMQDSIDEASISARVKMRGQTEKIGFDEWVQKKGYDPEKITPDETAYLKERYLRSKEMRVSNAETHQKSLQYAPEDVLKNVGKAQEMPAIWDSARSWNATLATEAKAAREKYNKLVAENAPAEQVQAAKGETVLAFAKQAAMGLAHDGLGAAAGRTLQIGKRFSKALSPAEQLFTKLSKQARMDQDALERLALLDPEDMKSVMDFAREKFKPTGKQYAYEVWLNGLLSSPKTHIVNATSNELTQWLTMLERPVAAGVDAARAALTGGKRERFFGETAADLKGMLDGLSKGVVAFKAAMDGQLTQTKIDHPRALPSKILGLPTPGTLLGASDEFFKAKAATREAYALAYRKARLEGKSAAEAFRDIPKTLGNIGESRDILKSMRDASNVAKWKAQSGQGYSDLENIVNKSLKEAERQTFTTEAGPLTGLALSAREKDPTGLLKVFLPFVQTPANIAKFAVDMTPASPAFWRALQKGGPEASEAIARVGVGTGIGILAATLAKDGTVTGGGPTDLKQKANLQQTGWQPYSVKIGDTYASFQRLEPLATVMGIAADMVEAKDPREQEHLAKKLIVSISNNLTDKTFMQGVENLVKVWSDPERHGENVLRSLTTSVVPGLVSTAARAVDPVIRDVERAEPDNPMAMFQAKIPVQSKELPARESVTGKELTRAGNALSRMISPVEFSSERPGTSLEREFNRLGYVPAKSQRSRKLEAELAAEAGIPREIELTSAEIAELNAIDKLAASYLEKAIASPEWAQAEQTDDPRMAAAAQAKKIKFIRSIYTKLRKPTLDKIKATRLLGRTP